MQEARDIMESVLTKLLTKKGKLRFSVITVIKTLKRGDSLDFRKDDLKWIQMTNNLGQQYVSVGRGLV